MVLFSSVWMFGCEMALQGLRMCRADGVGDGTKGSKAQPTKHLMRSTSFTYPYHPRGELQAYNVTLNKTIKLYKTIPIPDLGDR
ncbi:hypothetical protein C5167_037209 [Papaver somniferum]|uniref:Secreted protein n=1 Tax=Papaver somniferum TaxID=3469 RepID=A0A4Y7I8V1_PAPSO|nr:hypothetical protein C5167_037209 [Papaver somniferum]